MLLSLLLPGACAQAWGVTLPKGPLWVQQGSCVTLSCSYTLPVGEQLQAVVWYWGQHQGQSKTIYDSSTKEWMMFNGRAEFLGHLGHNCSLRLGNLQLGDGGFYHVKLKTQKRTWSSPRRLRLTVTEHPCPTFFLFSSSGTISSTTLTCSVPGSCPYVPLWYAGAGAEALQMKHGTSTLNLGALLTSQGQVLSCQLQGYRGLCLLKGAWSPPEELPAPPRVLVERVGVGPIREGDTFTLHCVGSSPMGPAPALWVHGLDFYNARHFLRVERATVSDGGNYSCLHWVPGAGHGYLLVSSITYVSVKANFTICVVASPGVQPLVGQPLALMCQFDGSNYAGLVFSWYKDGKQLDIVQQELVLPQVQLEDAGEYHCKAHSALGTAASDSLSITVMCGSDCHQLNPKLLAGTGTGVLLLLVLTHLAVYCLARRAPLQEQSQAVKLGVSACHGSEQWGPLYEVIRYSSDSLHCRPDEDSCSHCTEDYCN
ncbi:hypothetical protein Y1Q_0000384 [Alligator mississippiensis]|uniref:Ig-like domain-containing protein n=2 Tax=Alligator mississippiensis TaxID=8496 RepID=A0A151N6G0_ALLMI|nr:hypothetical protein Y1Q_0000384 [Alligator mississippiensis]